MNASCINDVLESHIDQLVEWLDGNGLVGWDPYDLWDSKIGTWMRLRHNLLSRITCYLVSGLSERFPLHTRKLLGVRPAVNAKGVGLLAAAMLELENCGKFKQDRNGGISSNECFSWLDENRISIAGGCGWGYPFDWQTRILIPRNTPTVVNSAIIGDAYWLKYKLYGDLGSLHRCEDICRFFVNGLNRTGGMDGAFCFSYTPLDTFQVHNANLMGAEFLVRIGKEIGASEWLDIGLRATEFSVKQMREDGTLGYWSNEQTGKNNLQDVYHSGFEIRALNSIAEISGNEMCRKVADEYFKTWRRDFFSPRCWPRYLRDEADVVEVHSCAEAILCTTAMFNSGRISRDTLLRITEGVMAAAVKRLWVEIASSGYFASKSYRQWYGTRLVKIPFIRWGQAWMLRALTRLFSTIQGVTAVDRLGACAKVS